MIKTFRSGLEFRSDLLDFTEKVRMYGCYELSIMKEAYFLLFNVKKEPDRVAFERNIALILMKENRQLWLFSLPSFQDSTCLTL